MTSTGGAEETLLLVGLYFFENSGGLKPLPSPPHPLRLPRPCVYVIRGIQLSVYELIHSLLPTVYYNVLLRVIYF